MVGLIDTEIEVKSMPLLDNIFKIFLAIRLKIPHLTYIMLRIRKSGDFVGCITQYPADIENNICC